MVHKMKNLLKVLLVLAFSASVFAEPAYTFEQLQKMLNEGALTHSVYDNLDSTMKDRLNLTPDQVSRLPGVVTTSSDK